jgi:hypothetical protein
MVYENLYPGSKPKINKKDRERENLRVFGGND